MARISIAIPTYEMNGQGAHFLVRALDSIRTQVFTDYEVIVSDNSSDDEIKKACEGHPVKYFKSDHYGIGANLNEAMRHCEGEIIKFLLMDDYLDDEFSLTKISNCFTEGVNWLATGCAHLEDGKIRNPHFPSYDHEIYKGKNTIGSPSVVSVRNKDLVYFDESLSWMIDCDYYLQMYKKFGEPKFLYDVNVVIGLGKHQVTNMLSEEIKRREVEFMIKKYA